jgi:hypothetical protein
LTRVDQIRLVGSRSKGYGGLRAARLDRGVGSESDGRDRMQAVGGGAKPAVSGLRRRRAATSPELGQIELERSVRLADCVYEKRVKRRDILGRRSQWRHGGAGRHRGGATRELRRRLQGDRVHGDDDERRGCIAHLQAQL